MEQEHIQTAFRTAFSNNCSLKLSLLSLPKSTDKASFFLIFHSSSARDALVCALLQSILINNRVIILWLNVISI